MPIEGPWKHCYATVNGVKLHYVEMGTGPLILLLHGFPEFWYSWHNQIPTLAEAGYRVVALDMRGYNLSEKPTGVSNYHVNILTKDIHDLIHALEEESCILAGHDWGGIVSWYTAMLYPEVIDKLIILNTPHPARFSDLVWKPKQFIKILYAIAGQLPWLPELLWSAFDFALVRSVLRRFTIRKEAFSDEELEKYTAAFRHKGAMHAALQYYRAWKIPFGFREWKKKSRVIHLPTLLLWGEQDRPLCIELTQNLAAWVPHIRIETFPHAGHWILADAPQEVSTAMLRFLKKI